jgi:glycosyltransferase involved in cell wall biosynthesis
VLRARINQQTLSARRGFINMTHHASVAGGQTSSPVPARSGHGSGSSARIPITVVMPVLNESACIRHSLEQLSWADEVIVVDGGSTDGTPELARRCGAQVLVVAGRTIAAQRNAGTESARNHWILALDADEEVTPELRRSLRELANDSVALHAAFRVRSRNWHLGRELRHGPWGRDWKVRVFSRDRRYTDQRVHEHLDALDSVGTLDGTLLHRPYRDLSHQVMKIAKYAQWAAEDLHARGRRAKMSDMITRPSWRFVRDYVVYSGWRDGIPGFVVASTSAFSVFLKYACLRTYRGP